jgi:hypothetical protein
MVTNQACWMSKPLSMLKRLVVIENNLIRLPNSDSHWLVQPIAYPQEETPLRYLAVEWAESQDLKRRWAWEIFFLWVCLWIARKSLKIEDRWEMGIVARQQGKGKQY